jgi:hypothetical protein
MNLTTEPINLHLLRERERNMHAKFTLYYFHRFYYFIPIILFNYLIINKPKCQKTIVVV